MNLIVTKDSYSFYKRHGRAEGDQPRIFLRGNRETLFFQTTTKGISDFAAVLRDGSNDGNGTWRNDITSMHSFDLLSAEEKVLGFEDKWISGSVEAVLHPPPQGERGSCYRAILQHGGIRRVTSLIITRELTHRSAGHWYSVLELLGQCSAQDWGTEKQCFLLLLSA